MAQEIKTTKVVNMIDGEYEIPIEAIYPVRIAKAAETRSIAVYGGKRLAVQAFEVAVDYNGGAEVYPQIQEQADCLLMRAGFLPKAKYQLGYSTVTIVDKKGNSYNETWLCRQKGLTESLVPIMVTGHSKGVKKIQIALLQSKRPIVYMIDRKTGKPNLFVWATKKVEVGKDKIVMPTYVNLGSLGKETVKAGIECHNIKFVQNLMLEDANDIDVKAGIKAPAVRIYTLGFDSPSTQRKGYFVLMKADIDANNIENEAAYAATRNEVVNSIGANVLELMDSLSMNKNVPADKLVKKVGRPSLVFTNSARGAKPTVMAFLCGKFKQNEIEFADGFGFVAESLIRRTLQLHGFEDVTSVCGTGLQCRLVTSKGYVLTVSQHGMAALIRGALAKINPDNITINNVIRVDINDSEAVHKAAIAIENGDYSDKIILVGPKGCGLSEVEYFADSNMLKAAFDFDKAIETSIMEMCHPAHDCFTSSQILESAITVPNYYESVMAIAKETIDKIFTIKAESSFTHKDVSNFDTFADGFLAKLNPEFIFADKALAKSQIQTMAKAAANRINNVRFDIEGGYVKALPDLGGFFSISLLNYGEVYSPDLKKYIDKTVMVVRYPHTATSEFAMVKVIGLDELKKRVFDKIDNKDFAMALWHMVKTIKKGQILLPSIGDPTLVAKLGGSDFDGDGVMAITDDRILEMYKHLTEGAVEFKPRKAVDDLKYDKFAPETARLYGILNGNPSTGEVVNHFYLLRSLLYDINNGLSQKDWDKFIFHILNFDNQREKDMINDDHKITRYGDKTYASREFLTAGPDNASEITDLVAMAKSGMQINNDEIDQFVDSIVVKNTSLRNLKNLKVVLESLDPAGASIVGRIIDAVKTGEKVTVPFAFLSDFVRNGAKIDCAYNKESQLLTISSNVGFSDNWKDFKFVGRKRPIVYVTKNPLYYVKKDLVAYVNQKIADLTQKVNSYSLTSKKVTGLPGAVGEAMACLCTSLMMAQTKTSLSEVSIPKVELSRYGVSMFRAVTANLDSNVRYLTAKYSSAIYKDNQLDGFGRFYQTLGAESVLYALGGNDLQVKTEIFARRNNTVGIEGEEVVLINGMSDKFFAADKITANGYLAFEQGRTYIVSSMKEMAQKAIDASIKENKIVLKIKKVNLAALSNKTEAAMVRLPLSEQIVHLQRLAGSASKVKNVRFAASSKATGGVVTEMNRPDRIVVTDSNGNDFVACFVYDYSFIGPDGKMNNAFSLNLNGRKIIIDYVIMTGDKEGHIFGRLC